MIAGCPRGAVGELLAVGRGVGLREVYHLHLEGNGPCHGDEVFGRASRLVVLHKDVVVVRDEYGRAHEDLSLEVVRPLEGGAHPLELDKHGLCKHLGLLEEVGHALFDLALVLELAEVVAERRAFLACVLGHDRGIHTVSQGGGGGEVVAVGEVPVLGHATSLALVRLGFAGVDGIHLLKQVRAWRVVVDVHLQTRPDTHLDVHDARRGHPRGQVLDDEAHGLLRAIGEGDGSGKSLSIQRVILHAIKQGRMGCDVGRSQRLIEIVLALVRLFAERGGSRVARKRALVSGHLHERGDGVGNLLLGDVHAHIGLHDKLLRVILGEPRVKPQLVEGHARVEVARQHRLNHVLDAVARTHALDRGQVHHLLGVLDGLHDEHWRGCHEGGIPEDPDEHGDAHSPHIAHAAVIRARL
mmetsp:Transcript_8594/g.25366  ORF Transcript_8594/g.25366 Transcript_8594/m.25366 type:complete len:412 (+) Transcript_8594:337-1572(+)